MQMIGKQPRVSDPFGVRRPRYIECPVRKSSKHVLIAQSNQLARRRIEHVNIQPVVVEGDELRIG